MWRETTNPHHDPHSPTVPSGCTDRGKQNAALGSWRASVEEHFQALGVGEDVVVEHPGMVEGAAGELLEGECPAAGRPQVGLRAEHRHRGPPRRRVHLHRRRAGVVDHDHRRRCHALGGDGVQTARQGQGGVVGQHERDRRAPELGGGRQPLRGRAPGLPARPRRPSPVPGAARRLGPLPHLAHVPGLDAESSPGAVHQATHDGQPLGAAGGDLEAPRRVQEVPREPARPAVAPRQCEEVAGQVVRPPRFVGVDGTVVAQRCVPARQGLAVGHLARAGHVDEHREARLPYAAVEVEVLEPEEQVGIREHAPVDHVPTDQGGPPRRDLHGGEVSGQATAGHDVHGVAGAGHEDPAEGDHRAHRGRRGVARLGLGTAPGLDARQQPGHARHGQMEQHHVVLAQVGPARGRVRERLGQPAAESSGRARVRRQPHHPDGVLERGVVEAAFAVHDHHDPVGGEALDVDERPHGGAGQAGPEVRDDDGGHPVEARAGARAQDSSHSVGTYTGDSTMTPLGALMTLGPKASNDASGCHGSDAVIPLSRGARIAPHNEYRPLGRGRFCIRHRSSNCPCGNELA